MKQILRIALVFSSALLAEGASPLETTDSLAVEEVELRAVEIVSGYIDSGVTSVRAALSSSSPLRAHQDQVIEVLLGPPSDSIWQIESTSAAGRVTFGVTYSSGIDDLVTLELVEENGIWKVRDIENLAVTPELSGATAGKQTPADPPASVAGKLDDVPLLIGLMAVALLAVTASFRTRATVRMVMLAVGMLSILGAAGLAAHAFVLHRDGDVSAAEDPASGAALLEALRDFRWSLENGSGVDLTKHRSLIDRSRAAALWSAQSLQLDMREADATSVLARVTDSTADPLLHLIRARLAAAMDRSSEAVLEYEKALAAVPSSDALRLEIVQSCLVHGFDDRARDHLEELAKRNSRNPSPYYFLAILDALDGDLDPAEGRLLRAMQMEPSSREALLSVPVVWGLLRMDRVAEQIDLFDVTERAWEFSGAPGRPLALSEGWAATRSGQALLLERGSTKLVLWGFAPHAPRGAELVDPYTWERLEREGVLAAPERLAKLASDAGSWLQPSARNRLTTAIEALDERNSWARIDELTGKLPSRLETVPTEVVLARGTALQGLGRTKEAESFAAAAAVAELKRENPDAERLYELGELMAELERYDVAIKLLERAESLHEGADLGDRIRQLTMTQRLGSNYQLHTTEHFDVRIPPEMPLSRAKKVGGILEAELKRIQQRLGVASFGRCTVNLLSWNDFKGVYTKSNHILGFYDGAITVPLADVPVFPPAVVGLLTHELTHAVVGQATEGKAPHWFQEGIAGRMQMLPASNAFNRYEDEMILPVRLLDPVLRGSPDPEMMEHGYVVSETFVRYLESEHGQPVWNELIDAFAEGLTTEEAFERVVGSESREIDLSFRDWGRSKSRLFLEDELVLYDEPDSSEWIRFSQP